jgi:hypothetical protein
VLLTVELTIKGRHARLAAVQAPLRGVRVAHEWRFTPETLSASLLDEIGTTIDQAALACLLSAVGMQLPLALELQEALGDLRGNFS